MKPMSYIEKHDLLKKAIQNIVDMPDHFISDIILFFHLNDGLFPEQERGRFEKLTDEEIEKMAIQYRKFFM